MLRVDTNTVARDVGRIVQAVSLMMAVSIIVAALNREFYTIPAFVVSALIMGSIGTGLVRQYRDAAPPEKRDAMVTAATAWAVVGVLGGLPFLLIAWTIQVDPFPVWGDFSGSVRVAPGDRRRRGGKDGRDGTRLRGVGDVNS